VTNPDDEEEQITSQIQEASGVIEADLSGLDELDLNSTVQREDEDSEIELSEKQLTQSRIFDISF
jgi:hypothetical protein